MPVLAAGYNRASGRNRCWPGPSVVTLVSIVSNLNGYSPILSLLRRCVLVLIPMLGKAASRIVSHLIAVINRSNGDSNPSSRSKTGSKNLFSPNLRRSSRRVAPGQRNRLVGIAELLAACNRQTLLYGGEMFPALERVRRDHAVPVASHRPRVRGNPCFAGSSRSQSRDRYTARPGAWNGDFNPVPNAIRVADVTATTTWIRRSRTKISPRQRAIVVVTFWKPFDMMRWSRLLSFTAPAHRGLFLIDLAKYKGATLNHR